jgi:uncharacterized membrane protein YhaH (DUF805 family)
MDYYLGVLRKYAEFGGRARRAEYWMFALVNFVISAGLAFVDWLVFGTSGILSGLYGLAVLIPGLAVGVRRLHDTDRSGWWILIGAIPILGAIVLLIFLVTDGTPGPNQYGPNPKEAVAAGAS